MQKTLESGGRVPPMEFAHPKILVVDDDLSIREMIAQTLEDAGYRVATASDGAAALDYLERTSELPCLVVLDLKMPVMDGFEFMDRQKQDARLATTPVLLLTADQTHQNVRVRLRTANFLTKPLNLDALVATVHRIGC